MFRLHILAYCIECVGLKFLRNSHLNIQFPEYLAGIKAVLQCAAPDCYLLCGGAGLEVGNILLLRCRIGDLHMGGVDAACCAAALLGAVLPIAYCLAHAARYAAATAEADAVALIGAVVGHVAGCERAGAQAVAARSFGRLRAGDDAAPEIGVALHVDAVAIVSGKDAALLGHAGVVGVDFAVAVAGAARGAIAHRDLSAHALLLALVRGCVLLALDVQAIGCHVHTAAMHLRAFEGECIARLDGGVAARIAHVRVAPAGAVAVRVALAAVDACGNAKASALYACAQRNSGTEAAGAVAAVLLAVLLRRLQRDVLCCFRLRPGGCWPRSGSHHTPRC